jgi:hypothetical protein
MKDEESIYKVTFEQMTDFKFIAAYDGYSKAWDHQQGIEEKRRLNGLISQLFNKEISYHQFYREIDQYTRGSSEDREFSRMKIQGERKRDYRRKEQRRSRQKRHKK